MKTIKNLNQFMNWYVASEVHNPNLAYPRMSSIFGKEELEWFLSVLKFENAGSQFKSNMGIDRYIDTLVRKGWISEDLAKRIENLSFPRKLTLFEIQV